ncbi:MULTISPECIES: response regulator transcription factor [Acinetobacter]|uniref:response regulator transcription factor n=1 Tax=Acinetobacter TaxID=469 RepID=UPI000CEC42B9|nr:MULTISPECIES: response regulator transcription factor [Acinetobacter]MCP0916427.1 response regulator transcription factor [Acinetobacter indicus]MCP0919552.1 response regulator transcription factor [Acinetobacter indicus]MCP0922219.1 response regulator transcription factor [Acinetobacter indicus]MDM1271665.1 response regulator transcription factor [Acinetobacter indicus]MDM1331331.1 response regulator transcription factor [Acinetobacter indicus]
MFVVLVEDDPYIAQSICSALDYLNISVEHVATARAADYFIRQSAVDLCLLDLGLPDQDGLELLQQWRQDEIHLPVLVLTARHQTRQCVEALNLGADDYLTKPFELDELIARIHALARRNRGFSSNLLQLGDLLLNRDTQEVTFQQQPVTLSRREYSLLETLMSHPNQILKNEQLLDKLYGYQDSIESNALNVHIYHLRQKLEPQLIQTIRGVGYMFKVPETES